MTVAPPSIVYVTVPGSGVPVRAAAHAPGREASTIRTLRERLRRPVEAFGDRYLLDLQDEAVAIAVWRASLPDGYRYQVLQAFSQVLDAAIRLGLVTTNPVRASGRNIEPKRQEVVPLDIREVDALAIELGEWGPLVVFAAETGLRPCEWIALEWADTRPAERVFLVQRTYAKGVHKLYGKTDRSRRRVPLTTRALTALEEMRRSPRSPLVFPSRAGGFIDINNFRSREWTPAFESAGIAHRRIYDLRHSFAAWALDAGVTTFELARYMGTGVRMIERTYGHLVADSDDRVRAKLEARIERVLTARVDAEWPSEVGSDAHAATGNPPFAGGF